MAGRSRIFPRSAHEAGLGGRFRTETTQVSAAFSYPGTIKAFHFHQYQTDLWVPAGMFQVALVDLRADSPTFGVKNTIYVGALRPWQILIPPGVGHGYKVIGEAAGHAGVCHQPALQSQGRRPHRLQRSLHSVRLGDCSTNEISGHGRRRLHRQRLRPAAAGGPGRDAKSSISTS